MSKFRSPRERDWKNLFKKEAYFEQNTRCKYCKSILTLKNCTADHVVAKSRGGKTTRENIVAACDHCNRIKGSISEALFSSLIKKPPEHSNVSFDINLIWVRRKLELKIIRSCKKIEDMFLRKEIQWMWYGIGLFDFVEIIIFGGFFITAVCYESIVLPIVVIMATVLIGHFLNGWNIGYAFSVLENNQLTVVLGIIGYIVFGILWATLKWKLTLMSLARTAKTILSDKSRNFSYEFGRKTGYSYPVKAENNKERIVVWMAYWPVSIVVTILADWIVQLWNNIYEVLDNFYQRMADRQFADIHIEKE